MKEFRLISVKDNSLKARYEESVEATGDVHVITYENATPVHDDLQEAMRRLAVHVREMGGFCPESPIMVTGYQRQNVGNTQLLTIYARFEASGSANVAVRIYLGRDDYGYVDMLLEDLSRCEREATLYIEKGKTFEGDTPVTIDEADKKLMAAA